MDESEIASLVDFNPHDQTLAERYVDYIFSEERGPVREAFAKAFSDGGYTPDRVTIFDWAVGVLKESDVEILETHPQYVSVAIFDECYVPYLKGQMGLSEAKAKAVKIAEVYFRGTEFELMFDKAPSSPDWHAAHIFRIHEKLHDLLHDFLEERKELETGKYEVSDYFVSRDESEREIERKRPMLTAFDLGVKAGFYFRDAWWLSNHAKSAAKYYEQAKSRKEGAQKGAKATAEKAATLRSDCLRYVAAAYAEKGAAFLGANLGVKAQTIMEIALRDRPDDFVGPQGKPLSYGWFRETLEDYQADGQLGEEIENAVKSRT